MQPRPFLVVPPAQQLIVPNRADRRRAGLVRNVETGRVLPCCWQDCTRDGDNRHRVEIPHPTPRWRDPATGRQEMLVYVFCNEEHKRQFVKGTPYERYAS